MPFFVEFSCADLTQSAFSAGRASDCDFRFVEGDIPTRKLNRLSKKHFHIVKDLSDINSPAFIEVKIMRRALFFCCCCEIVMIECDGVDKKKHDGQL